METYKAEWSHILSHPRTQRLIELAVEEDLEDQGDVTSDPIFPFTTLEPFSVLEKMRLCVASRFVGALHNVIAPNSFGSLAWKMAHGSQAVKSSPSFRGPPTAFCNQSGLF